MGAYVNTSAWRPSGTRPCMAHQSHGSTVHQKSKLHKTQGAIIYQVYYDGRNADAAKQLKKQAV